MLICNKCGKTGKRGKFCVYCGGELSEFFTVKTSEEKPPLGECPECGKEYRGGNFCVFCGAEIKLNNAVPESAAEAENIPSAEITDIAAGIASTVEDETAPAELAETETAPAMEAAPAAEDVPAPEITADIGGSPEDTSSGAETEDEPEIISEGPAAAEESPAKLQCVECGKIMDTGKFCTSCGGTLKPMGAVEPSSETVDAETVSAEEIAAVANAEAPVQPDKPAELKCEKCGNIMNKGKFCTICGGNLVPVGDVMPAPAAEETVKLQCELCGKIMDKGKFCTTCGGNLRPMGGTETAADRPETPSVIPAPTASAPVKLQCVGCGNIMDRGKFCTVCGGELRPMSGSPEVDPGRPVTLPNRTPTPIPMPVPQPSPTPAPQPAPAPVPQPAPIPQPVPTPVPQPIPQTAPAPSAQSGGLVCPTCGKSFERGKFCTVCGTTLVEQTPSPAKDDMLHCVQCGKTFPGGKFCTSCGGQLVTSDKLNV